MPEINLYYEKTLSKQNLEDLNFKLIPIWEPKIILTKVDILPNSKTKITYQKIKNNQYLISNKNTNRDQDQYVLNSLGFGWKTVSKKDFANTSQFLVEFWLTKIFFIFWILTFLLIFYYFFYKFFPLKIISFIRPISNFLFLTFNFLLYKPLLFIWQFLKSFFIKNRFIFLLITFIGIIYDIFFLKKYFDLIFLFLILLWISVLIAYRAESKVSFVFALVFLIICAFLSIIKKGTFAEKTAIWAYMFLVVGTIKSIVELKVNQKDHKEYPLFFKEISNHVFKFILLVLKSHPRK
ncbi:MAG: hypothetical protein ACD_49C00097G0002 [uncultured bacterium (gcode 4)]|uniref:Uncharacterized protein n=1 Tax=uncultured bacterium (gcode 4) TaxID=1234023 RepID=K2AVS9_9BACT|nr:MAG: hypothetical protein ACD_49C00097G0002 [uncultured bacterium (gcode 4)]